MYNELRLLKSNIIVIWWLQKFITVHNFLLSSWLGVFHFGVIYNLLKKGRRVPFHSILPTFHLYTLYCLNWQFLFSSLPLLLPVWNYFFTPLLCFIFVVLDSRLLLSYCFLVINPASEIPDLTTTVIHGSPGHLYIGWTEAISACLVLLNFKKAILFVLASEIAFEKKEEKKLVLKQVLKQKQVSIIMISNVDLNILCTYFNTNCGFSNTCLTEAASRV